jgi:hypothetical protein
MAAPDTPVIARNRMVLDVSMRISLGVLDDGGQHEQVGSPLPSASARSR